MGPHGLVAIEVNSFFSKLAFGLKNRSTYKNFLHRMNELPNRNACTSRNEPDLVWTVSSRSTFALYLSQ